MLFRNPLNKRIPRMLIGNAGKFIAIFLFLILSIAFATGFLVAELSLKVNYDSTFEEYKIEDGHFELFAEMSDSLAEALEEEELSIYPLLNKDVEMADGRTVRIYPVREEINLIALLEGSMPENGEEIVLDRLFAGNNKYEVGSRFKLGTKEFRVSGIVAFSDYSCLFKNNADGIFDNTNFGVAAVTQEAFDEVEYNDLHYTYAWRNSAANLTVKETSEFADDILDIVKEHDLIKDFVRQSDNQAIRFSGEDLETTRSLCRFFFTLQSS